MLLKDKIQEIEKSFSCSHDEAVAMLASFLGKSKSTVYGWLGNRKPKDIAVFVEYATIERLSKLR